MTKLPEDYLSYPHRSYGMDHDHYSWSMLIDRPKIDWSHGKPLSVFLNVNLEFFPLNQKGIPFKVPGGMTMPYPDLRHFTLRDYGNRVGVYRILKVLDEWNLTPSFSINGQVVERNPALMQEIKSRNPEIIAHGWNMDQLHYGEMDPGDEEEQIQQTISVLQDYFEKPIKGWLSPAKSQSQQTPDLLAAAGVQYMMDWVNDELPYQFHTKNGDITSFPLSTEIEDRFILMNNLHSSSSWAEQVLDACDFLTKEAVEEGGRILTLNIHPWLTGQPHRIKYFRELIAELKSRQDTHFMTAESIVSEFLHTLEK